MFKLTPLRIDSTEDFSDLTLGHFLIGGNMLAPAEPEKLSSLINLVNRWRKIKVMQHLLCRRWKEECLRFTSGGPLKLICVQHPGG